MGIGHGTNSTGPRADRGDRLVWNAGQQQRGAGWAPEHLPPQSICWASSFGFDLTRDQTTSCPCPQPSSGSLSLHTKSDCSHRLPQPCPGRAFCDTLPPSLRSASAGHTVPHRAQDRCVNCSPACTALFLRVCMNGSSSSSRLSSKVPSSESLL